jgi:MoxR-like ATPase
MELAFVQGGARGAPARLAAQVTSMVQELRAADLYKVPGVSETIDWVTALVALDRDTLDPDAIDETLGVVLKAKEDVEAVRGHRAAELLDRATRRHAS